MLPLKVKSHRLFNEERQRIFSLAELSAGDSVFLDLVFPLSKARRVEPRTTRKQRRQALKPPEEGRFELSYGLNPSEARTVLLGRYPRGFRLER